MVDSLGTVRKIFWQQEKNTTSFNDVEEEMRFFSWSFWCLFVPPPSQTRFFDQSLVDQTSNELTRPWRQVAVGWISSRLRPEAIAKMAQMDHLRCHCIWTQICVSTATRAEPLEPCRVCCEKAESGGEKNTSSCTSVCLATLNPGGCLAFPVDLSNLFQPKQDTSPEN